MTTKTVAIPMPAFRYQRFTIRGTEIYVQNKFSAKAREKMRTDQEMGWQAKSRKVREPKDFGRAYADAIHVSTDGWHGIPASAFRAAMISACRIVGFAMTRAKLSVFVEAEGIDADDATPLVRITKGEPEYREDLVRQQTTTDLRPRPMWTPGWEARVVVRYDTAQFSDEDVYALMLRVGSQVGIGEGRPDSRSSAGMGWGLFEVVEAAAGDLKETE